MTKRRLRKSIGVLFLVAAILATQIPSSSSAERLSQKEEFQLDGDTLIKYTGTADTVSVPSAVKVIGEEAFADNENIVSVSLPSSLEKISYAAFSDCNNLKEVSVPDSCEEIGTAAFSNCSSLTKVSIGKEVKSLGNGIFVGCKKIKEFSISSPNFLIIDSAIYDKNKSKLIEVLPSRSKERLEIPSTVTSIYPYSIYGCDNLNTVNLPSELMEIPAYALSGCNGLTSISIPYSVKNIDAKAFENCSSLTNVNIPESVSYIHKTAFDGCINLNIIAETGSYADKWFQSFDKSNVAAIDSEDNDIVDEDNDSEPIEDDTASNSNGNNDTENKTENSNGDSSDNQALSSPETLGNSKIVGRHAVIFIDNTKQTVKGNTSLSSTTQESTAFGSEVTTDDNSIDIDNEDIISDQIIDIIQKESQGKGLSLPKLAIVNGKIANKAFYNDSSLKEYQIPEEVTSIGDFSFARSSIESIVIGDNVEHIGYGAFYHCDSLTNVSISSNVKDIESSAFDKTPWFENWQKSDSNDFLIVGDNILIGYKGSSSIVYIPDNVKVIAGECFMNHKGITEVYLPDSLEKICEGAFKGCVNLKYVSKGSYVKEIEDRAFDGCPIETVRIVDSVSSLGLGAYDYTNPLIDNSKKVVYFHGDTLPTISYVKTSTRLSNFNYRKNVFSGINVAIINSAEINLKDTVLDNALPGFRGLICTIEDKADSFTTGSLNIVTCNLSREEAASFEVPDEMEIYGKTYAFNNEQLAEILSQAKEGIYEVEKSSESTFNISGSDREYVLKISKEKGVNEAIKSAYSRIYGDQIPDNSISYDISMWENDNRVLLTKFGKRKIEVNIPLPQSIPSENLHLVCLDEDGQLEDISYLVEEANGKYQVSFNISHTGQYAIYNANENTSTAFNLDSSPETGDFIHPKWILSLGLLAASLAMFLVRGKP